MVWILVDVLVVALAAGLLVLSGLTLWRQVKVLGRTAGAAAEQFARVGEAVAQLPEREPHVHSTPPRSGQVRRRRPGVR